MEPRRNRGVRCSRLFRPDFCEPVIADAGGSVCRPGGATR